jgi:hypothetical protein
VVAGIQNKAHTERLPPGRGVGNQCLSGKPAVCTLEELLRPVKGPREAVRNTTYRTSTWEKKK